MGRRWQCSGELRPAETKWMPDTDKVSWVPGKPAPLWLSSWGCSSPLELRRSALPFKKGTCKWNSHSAMTLDVQCGRLSLIHVQVHTTHSWLRACLSCPLTPITSQKFCSLLSLTMFWYVGLNLYTLMYIKSRSQKDLLNTTGKAKEHTVITL